MTADTPPAPKRNHRILHRAGKVAPRHLIFAVLLGILVCAVSFPYVLSEPPAGITPVNESVANAALVEEMIAAVDGAELFRTVQDLENVSTREYGTDGNRRAAAYLYRRFDQIPGLTVQFQNATLNNVIATLPGRDRSSDAIVVVGAHYDSISSVRGDAPGATDNACGVAIVLEIARIMSAYDWDNTLVFALWNGEEQGMLGSTDYARNAVGNGLNIRLYLNFDSACYDPDDRFVLDIMADNRSAGIAPVMAQYNDRFGINFTLTSNAHSCNSDHKPFQDAGYPALMTHSEEHGPAHSPEDTIDRVSGAYATRNARLGIPVLARFAKVRTASQGGRPVP